MPRGNGDAAISSIPLPLSSTVSHLLRDCGAGNGEDVLVSILSPAQSGPIGGNAISVSCQNSNCLRRMRRRVIQSVKRLPFGGIFCSAIDDIKGEAKSRREGGAQQRSAITSAINIAIRPRPDSKEKFAEFVCTQYLVFTVFEYCFLNYLEQVSFISIRLVISPYPLLYLCCLGAEPLEP